MCIRMCVKCALFLSTFNQTWDFSTDFRKMPKFHLNSSSRSRVTMLLGSVSYVFIVGSNAGYTMFRGSVKSTGYPLHSLVSLSLPLPYVTVCHHISTGLDHADGRTYSHDKAKSYLSNAPQYSTSTGLQLTNIQPYLVITLMSCQRAKI